jgi:hypothetical protein
MTGGQWVELEGLARSHTAPGGEWWSAERCLGVGWPRRDLGTDASRLVRSWLVEDILKAPAGSSLVGQPPGGSGMNRVSFASVRRRPPRSGQGRSSATPRPRRRYATCYTPPSSRSAAASRRPLGGNSAPQTGHQRESWTRFRIIHGCHEKLVTHRDGRRAGISQQDHRTRGALSRRGDGPALTLNTSLSTPLHRC